MTSTAEAAASPSTVRLCGTDYRMRPLQERDMGEFVLWCQDRQMELANRTAKGMEDREMAESLVAHAHDAASRLTTTHPAVLKMMVDMDGGAELIWYSLRDFHPDLTYTPPTENGQKPEQLVGSDAVRAMLLDPDTLEAATRKYEQLNAGGDGRAVADPFVSQRRRESRRRRRQRQRQRKRQQRQPRT